MSYYKAAQPYSDSQIELQGFRNREHADYADAGRADTYSSQTPVMASSAAAPVKPLRGGAGRPRVKWIAVGLVLFSFAASRLSSYNDALHSFPFFSTTCTYPLAALRAILLPTVWLLLPLLWRQSSVVCSVPEQQTMTTTLAALLKTNSTSQPPTLQHLASTSPPSAPRLSTLLTVMATRSTLPHLLLQLPPVLPPLSHPTAISSAPMTPSLLPTQTTTTSRPDLATPSSLLPSTGGTVFLTKLTMTRKFFSCLAFGTWPNRSTPACLTLGGGTLGDENTRLTTRSVFHSYMAYWNETIFANASRYADMDPQEYV